MKLDPKQSHYVLQILLARRRVRSAQVRAPAVSHTLTLN